MGRHAPKPATVHALSAAICAVRRGAVHPGAQHGVPKDIAHGDAQRARDRLGVRQRVEARRAAASEIESEGTVSLSVIAGG